MESIKDKVAVVGMGCTNFGEKWGENADDMAVEATKEALEDAGLELKDINAAVQTTLFTGETGSQLARWLKLNYVPVSRVENFCSGGLDAFRTACYYVASGTYDIVLANGTEKLMDHAGGFGKVIPSSFDLPGVDHDLPPATTFAFFAVRYMEKHNISYDRMRRILARLEVKNHHNGTLAPKSHLKREITIDDVLNAPMVTYPFGLYDCCGMSDGSASCIVTTPEIAESLRDDYVLVKGLAIANGAGQAYFKASDNTLIGGGDKLEANFPETVNAARSAYAQAGVKDPRKEVSHFEVHDCFSSTELLTYEDLLISPFGKAPEDLEAGRFDLDGEQPCNTDGGLKSFGHPVSASGIRMLYELYKQLQGKAEKRQIKNPKLGLAHNLGGVCGYYNVAVCLIGGRD
ncbi:MAG: acetyl-CoA acetyltransferase [Chloroflexi bacterium]|nr:acetyl-CoA acetyltransferase [Chloroflexota bacterium]